MASKKKKKAAKTKKMKKTKKVKKGRKTKKQQQQAALSGPGPGSQNPFKLVMYHLVRIPWYIIKTFDWLFTLFTALLVYLSKWASEFDKIDYKK